MLEVLKEIGNATVWAFWAPVVVWTGLAAVAVLVLRRARGLHPTAGYRLHQAVLLALPVSILTAPWMPALWTPTVSTPAVSTPAVLAPTSLAPAFGPPMSTPARDLAPSIVPSRSGAVEAASLSAPGVDIVAVLLGSATVAIVLLAVGRLAMVTTDLRQLRRLRRLAPPVNDPAPRRMLRELAEQLDVRRPVALLEGPPDSAPLTFGAWRPVILVPRVLLDSPGSLRTVLAHELIHIRRADYCWALLDSLTAAVFAVHPLVWVLRRGIERCRETSCDAEVLARGFARPKPYAELLAHTHTPTQFPIPAAAASLSAPSLKLKERLETMKNFAHRRLTSRQRLGIVLCAGLVCLVIAVAAACAIRTEEEPPLGWEVTGVALPPRSGQSEALRQVREALTEVMEKPGQFSDAEALTRLREYVETLEGEGVGEVIHYTIPRLTDESISYYYNATEEDVLQELKRLDVQIEYLQEQIDETRATLDELARPAREAGRFWIGTGEYEAYSRASAPFSERLDFLKSMRAERVRMAEVLKLEYETQKRMGDSRPVAAPGRLGDIF